jgi:CBS domain-containing protein
MSLKKARDLMTENPACISPETTSQEAARLMETQDVGSLPVVESSASKRLVGIVTDRDLALRVVGRGESSSVPVSGVMSTRDLACVQPDQDLDEVEKLMAHHQVRRIPVIDEAKRVVGVIAQADLARERKAIGERDFGKVMAEISEPAGVR